MQLVQAASPFIRLITIIILIPAFSESIIPRTAAATYTFTQSIQGPEFLTAFDVQNIDDPTHGHVDYVNMAEATRLRILEAPTPNSFFLRAGNEVVPDGGKGRKSARLRSKKSYTTHVEVHDIRHMPQGCGTWPAVWTLGPDPWPTNGEIDIVEGANDRGPNAATLHTSQGCSMPDIPAERMQGTLGNKQCASSGTDNTGCGIKFPTANSFGPEFNSNGGGWFAMERTNTYIKMWFWPRKGGEVPTQIQTPGDSVNPDRWGLPTAYFPNTQCNMVQHFRAHQMIINLTFCGDWAGATYQASGCPGDCKAHVGMNPQAFQEAFFDFVSIRLYSPPNE